VSIGTSTFNITIFYTELLIINTYDFEPGVMTQPVISALGRLRQEDPKFETSLGYTETPCLKKKKVVNIYD
jgi:hypothetical protein